jgi:hypothetical protein
VVAHGDGTPAPEAVLPTDMATVVIDEVVLRDGSLALEVVPEVNTSTVGGATVATSVSDAATNGPATSSGQAAGAPSSLPWVVVNDNTIEEPSRSPMPSWGTTQMGHQEMFPSPTLCA